MCIMEAFHMKKQANKKNKTHTGDRYKTHHQAVIFSPLCPQEVTLGNREFHFQCKTACGENEFEKCWLQTEVIESVA